jgi:hypothetical protein
MGAKRMMGIIIVLNKLAYQQHHGDAFANANEVLEYAKFGCW